MDARRERAMVGLFVLVATGLLIFTLFFLTGLFDHSQPIYRTYLSNAGGLAPGSDVRYAGGPPIGHVAEVHTDPNDVTRLEVERSREKGVDGATRFAQCSPDDEGFARGECVA